jgi:hypothetical protein
MTITDTCNHLYAKFQLVQRVADGPHSNHTIRTTFLVSPGADRTLNMQALMHLGLWQLPLNTWYLRVMHIPNPCGG